MRLFKPNMVNWKYILGEIFLIFIGISLAIWFNNWNASNQIDENKRVAIDKIEEEIQNNLRELVAARNINIKIPEALEAYKEMRSKTDGQVISSVSEMQLFQKSFPGFLLINDSLRINDSIYSYSGDTKINLELPALSEIAWETSRNMGLTNAFGYECLYGLESMYNVQRLVQNEVNKAAEALQTQEIARLLRILGFINQFDAKLEADYNSMLENISKCL